MPAKDNDLGRDLTPAQVAEYNEAYRKGCDLLEKHLTLHGQEPAPSSSKEAEVREGIRWLKRAVGIQPRAWCVWWMIGKAHQALDDHARACEAFRQANRLCGHNADVPRELSLECLQVGQFVEAVEVARRAVRLNRADPDLQANLALALLLAGDLDEALDQAEQASARSPQDEINAFLLGVIREVNAGRRPQPKTLAELEG